MNNMKNIENIQKKKKNKKNQKKSIKIKKIKKNQEKSKKSRKHFGSPYGVINFFWLTIRGREIFGHLCKIRTAPVPIYFLTAP